MSEATFLERSVDACVAIVDAPEGLTALRRPDCAAAIWRRRPAPAFRAWIDALDPAFLPKGRVILRPAQARLAVTHLCDAAELEPGPQRDVLIDDAAALADVFSKVMNAPYLRLRFDVVTNDACRRFHVDSVIARLVCAYRGRGTQYGVSDDGEAPREIFDVETGSPMMMRGKLWPESPKSDLLHRSPPIAGTGETRLLLVLDVVDDPADHPEPAFLH